jgi:peptidoglycan/xylan/chitin deacetylase (PgdA/CDA1 family)
LLYHDIDSKEKPTEKEDLATKETVVRIEEFESHMQYLANEDYRVLSVKEYLSELHGGNISDKDIVLTFDDGHISNYQYALPVLRQHSFSATFFLIADNIGKPYYMGHREIKELMECNMEIGSHGLTHSSLSELRTEEIRKEVGNSKIVIEAVTGTHVETFAYPGGHLNAEVVKCVKEMGYNTAVSCIVGRNNRKTDPFLLKRIELRRGTSLKELKSAISTTNIRFFQFIDMGKSLVKNTVGLENYKLLRRRLYFLYPFKR